MIAHLKATSPTKNKIGHGDADILVYYFAMTFWCVIITKYRHWTNNGNTWCISWDNDDTLLSVYIAICRVALAHYQMNLASGVASTADIPRVLLVPNFLQLAVQ